MPLHRNDLQRCPRSLLLTLLSLPEILTAGADPAGRVGRVARIVGPVFLSRATGGEAEPALGNWPLTSGDILSTGAGGRAEVEVGSSLLQLDGGSVLEFVRVDDQRLVLCLRAGSVIARCRSAEVARQFAIDAGTLRFELREAGRYRFDAGRAGVSGTAYQGALSCSAADRCRHVRVGAGQMLRLADDQDADDEILAAADDEFAGWSLAREASSGVAGELRYVSPEMTGAGDLAVHGDWYETPAYGAVWFPRALAADWAPYRAGCWAWLEPWGWTWIGDEPWGFAPFHYGRWACFRGAWGWVPGRRVQRPVYAPALVAWSDPVAVGRAHCGIQPAAGWMPLAPHATYVPSYRCSGRYRRQLNAPHVSNGNQLREAGRHVQATAHVLAGQRARWPETATGR